jgi:cyanophycin synthetase
VDIISIKTYKGKNIYSHKPVIKAEVDVGELYDTPTCRIDKFNEGLLALLPGLRKHFCSVGHEGGFLERLEEGTYLTHVTEHMVLELQSLKGYDVHFGRSRLLSEPRLYYMVFEFINEKYAVECLLTAVEIVNRLIEGIMPQMDEILRHLSKTAAETDLGPSTAAIFKEALRRGIPVNCLDNSSILQLGCGKYTRYMEASLTDRPGCIPVDITGNKHLTKAILSDAGIPVPQGELAYTFPSARSAALRLGYPVVLKPFDANQGKGVFTDISSMEELETAYAAATKFSRAVIVERHIRGKDYRLLAVGGKLAAAAERIPPCVFGDGLHTIRELVDRENENPSRGFDHEKPLTKIRLDGISRQVLAKAGYEENSIPPKGVRVVLRYNGNISTGGTAVDCTDIVHPYNAMLAVKAAELLNLDVAGVDITCEDISKPVTEGDGAIIEVNAAPGLRMHLYPSAGTPRNVAKDILDHLYPENTAFSIPIIAVTGTNGKTTVTRLIEHTLALSGLVVGSTNTSGIYVNGECILKGDNTGAASASMLLRDRRIEAAVLETARGGIIRRGLGYDLADVGMVVNISDDHIGMDGINTLEELAMVKALVVEAVKPSGFAVLNADDAMTPFLMSRVRSKVMLFSRTPKNPLITEQIEKGGPAVYTRNGFLYFAGGGEEIGIMRVDGIPITYGGTAECNIENSLAAASALIASGVSIKAVKQGLSRFEPDIRCNPGRFNTFSMGNFTVMLDYGHNSAGYRAAIQVMRNIGASAYIGVIGMPGDRRNDSIIEVGQICARSFSRLYIKEDNDLRRRDAGEVADLLYNAAVMEGMNPRDVTVLYSETRAFETAIMEAGPGDLVVLFYEELGPALEIIEKCRAAIIEREAAEDKAGEGEAGDPEEESGMGNTGIAAG